MPERKAHGAYQLSVHLTTWDGSESINAMSHSGGTQGIRTGTVCKSYTLMSFGKSRALHSQH